MTDSPTQRDLGVSVTIKFGTDFNAPWMVFTGTAEQVREQVISAFGFEAEAVAEWSDAELVVEATKAANGLFNAAEGLGGTVIGGSRGGRGRRGGGGGSGAFAKAREPETTEAATPPPAPKTLLELIAEADSIEALKDLWVKRQAEIVDDVLAAWKERGKALKGS